LTASAGRTDNLQSREETKALAINATKGETTGDDIITAPIHFKMEFIVIFAPHYGFEVYIFAELKLAQGMPLQRPSDLFVPLGKAP